MSVAEQAQTSLYEKVIENEPLENALDLRQSCKEARGEAQKAFKEADARVKALIEPEELGVDSAVRVGRFVIRKLRREGGKTVSFETTDSERLRISLIDEDA